MKSTGIVRGTDSLGRVVLPNELRKTMNLQPGTPLEFFVEQDKIILKRYNPGCVFCGEENSEIVTHFKGKTICFDCINEMSIAIVGR